MIKFSLLERSEDVVEMWITIFLKWGESSTLINDERWAFFPRTFRSCESVNSTKDCLLHILTINLDISERQSLIRASHFNVCFFVKQFSTRSTYIPRRSVACRVFKVLIEKWQPRPHFEVGYVISVNETQESLIFEKLKTVSQLQRLVK